MEKHSGQYKSLFSITQTIKKSQTKGKCEPVGPVMLNPDKVNATTEENTE